MANISSLRHNATTQLRPPYTGSINSKFLPKNAITLPGSFVSVGKLTTVIRQPLQRIDPLKPGDGLGQLLPTPRIDRLKPLLDEAAIAAEKNLKPGYNSHHCPIPGTIKFREVYHESS